MLLRRRVRVAGQLLVADDEAGAVGARLVDRGAVAQHHAGVAIGLSCGRVSWRERAIAPGWRSR